MFRLDILLAVVLVPSYIVQASELTQFTPDDDSTDGPLEYYNSDNSDEFIDPSRQNQDYSSALAGFYKLSEAMSRQKQHPIADENDDEPIQTNSHNDNSDNVDVDEEISGSPSITTTTIFPNDQQTTFRANDFTENLSHSNNDVVLENPSNHEISTRNSTDTELSANKHAKMFLSLPLEQQQQQQQQQQQRQQNEPIYQYFSENSIQSNSAYNHNDTDEFNRMENSENDTNNQQSITLQFPITTITSILAPSASPTLHASRTTKVSNSISRFSNLPSTLAIASVPVATVPVTTASIKQSAAAAAATVTATMTTTTTAQSENNNNNNQAAVTLAPYASKKAAKKIETTTRVYKYSADEILRKYIEDTYIRAPLAALINTSPESLRKAKILWKSALRPNTPIDIVLVAFNSSGVGVTYTFKNTRTMMAGIDSVQESREMRNGGSAFYGIMRASELIPYDSAIFISTDSVPDDINLARYAAITLLKKRIRLYVIWFGAKASDENDTFSDNREGGILGEVALRSGGEIFRVTEEALGPNSELGLVTHFLQNDIQGAQVLDIPVNTTASNLQIKIQGNIEQATITTPTGG